MQSLHIAYIYGYSHQGKTVFLYLGKIKLCSLCFQGEGYTFCTNVTHFVNFINSPSNPSLILYEVPFIKDIYFTRHLILPLTDHFVLMKYFSGMQHTYFNLSTCKVNTIQVQINFKMFYNSYWMCMLMQSTLVLQRCAINFYMYCPSTNHPTS